MRAHWNVNHRDVDGTRWFTNSTFVRFATILAPLTEKWILVLVLNTINNAHLRVGARINCVWHPLRNAYRGLAEPKNLPQTIIYHFEQAAELCGIVCARGAENIELDSSSKESSPSHCQNIYIYIQMYTSTSVIFRNFVDHPHGYNGNENATTTLICYGRVRGRCARCCHTSVPLHDHTPIHTY